MAISDTCTPRTSDPTWILRHTPLSALMRDRSSLVQTLVAVPELHARVRPTWARQDPTLTAQLFNWVEQARLHNTRTDGHEHTSLNWMRDAELAA